MNSVPGKSRSTNLDFAVCAQRVPNDIVPDIGDERGVGDAVARSPPGGSPGSLLPIVHCDFE
jgi:hypothetical protein